MKFKPEDIKLIIGLGNPGRKYKKTYHNVGHLGIDYLKKHMPPTRYKLLKTDDFMNRSGSFVKSKLDELDLKPEEILIIHDDSDIEIGEHKLSFERGSAGHKGIKSIIEKIGGKNFWRARIGIREKDDERKAKKFILEKISKQNLKSIENVFWSIATKLKEGE